MTNINRICATLRLIRHSVVPATGKGHCPLLPLSGTMLRVPPGAFAALLPALDRYLRSDGRLELLFEAAYAPAAPFLLYHLKRHGFSDCKAVITADGIVLTARR